MSAVNKGAIYPCASPDGGGGGGGVLGDLVDVRYMLNTLQWWVYIRTVCAQHLYIYIWPYNNIMCRSNTYSMVGRFIVDIHTTRGCSTADIVCTCITDYGPTYCIIS